MDHKQRWPPEKINFRLDLKPYQIMTLPLQIRC